jgi:hypothetical protein
MVVNQFLGSVGTYYILLRNGIITSSKTSVKLTAFLTLFDMPADPSRPGMHPKLIKYLLALRAPRIVYISCNPATCARDLDLLCHNEVSYVDFKQNLVICIPYQSLCCIFCLS